MMGGTILCVSRKILVASRLDNNYQGVQHSPRELYQLRVFHHLDVTALLKDEPFETNLPDTLRDLVRKE